MDRTLIAEVNLKQAFTLTPGGEPVGEVYQTPADLINVILPNLFVVAGLLLFIYIFVAGFKFVTSDNKTSKEQGAKSLKYAITGFLLLFASYWIAQIIEYYTGVPILG
jgi:uncharacterized membrane protein